MLKLGSGKLACIAIAMLTTVSLPALSAEQQLQVIEAARHDTSRPMREIIADLAPLEPQTGEPREIPNIFPKGERTSYGLAGNGALRSLGVQRAPSGTPSPPITFSFDGLSLSNGGGGIPPDTNGDISPNEYIQWINTSWAIINRVTGVRSTPVQGNSFWAGFGGPCQTRNDGDPIALWDDRAERWVMSQFVTSSPFAQCFAVSATSDPLGSYHRYQFNLPIFGDYPHIGVWTDGGSQSSYLLVTHDFSGNPLSSQGVSLIAVERDKMLAGQPAAMVRFSGLSQFGIQPAHLEGQVPAPSGACPIFVHFDRTGGNEYRLFDLCLNWANPVSSTLSTEPARLTPRFPFIPNFNGVPQPSGATSLDSFGSNTMYRATARAFPPGAPADISMVINHSVQGPSDQSAVKWVQFNFNAGPTSFPNDALFVDGFETVGRALPAAVSKQIFDEGTFAPDEHGRWMAGIAIDRSGNIGLGYSVSSETLNPQLRTTGRTLADIPGTLQGEQTCTPPATGRQLSTSGRWGDYASMSVDPVDECTFWFTSEYYPTTATSSWFTRICSFKFAECGIPTMALVADSPSRVEICGAPTPASPTYDLRLGIYDGFNTQATFSISGLPGGVTPIFSPQTLTPPGSSLLTLNGAETLSTGEYSATVTATAGSVVRTLPIELGVSATLAGVPSLTLPADAAVDVKVRPTLSWAAVPGALSYAVEVSLSNTFATLVASDVVTATEWAVDVGLNPSTVYFWRVRANNYCGEGAYSNIRSFTTGVPGTCPAGTTLTNAFTDDFQSGANGWTTDGTGGSAWTQGAAAAGTGLTTTVWRIPNNSVTSDRGLISPSIVISPTAVAAFASFDAHYSFETDAAPGCWDGAAIEARVAGAGSFGYLSPNNVPVNGYNGVILAGAPLAGREVWCRLPSPTPARSIVDLDSFIGESMQLRFRASSDSNTTAATPNGMSIDNLRIDVCELNP